MASVKGLIEGFCGVGPQGDQLMDVSIDDEYDDISVPIHPSLGEGVARTIKVRGDVNYHIVRHGPSPEGYVSSLISDESAIKFGFLMAPTDGTVWCDGVPESAVHKAGALPISSHTGNTHFRAARMASLHMIMLIIDSDTILDYIRDSPRDYEDSARRLLFESHGEPCMLNAEFDARAVRALVRVETYPYRGGLKRLFLEGKALELAALSLEPFMKRLPESPRSIAPRDTRLMRGAGEYLDARLESPPTLALLAREVGVSVSKLKRDFPRVHGMNPHEYIVTRRMQSARELLDSGASVKEAAIYVGLKSQGSFIKQYRRQYGETPGKITRSRD